MITNFELELQAQAVQLQLLLNYCVCFGLISHVQKLTVNTGGREDNP